MGHDIDICFNGPNGDILASTYLSFNWTRFKTYFHISQINGHSSELVVRRLQEALDQLEKDGFVPNAQMRVDAWGSFIGDHKKNPLSDDRINTFFDPDYDKDLKCMFAHHLKTFLTIAEEYPEGYWYSDQIKYGQSLYGVEPKL